MNAAALAAAASPHRQRILVIGGFWLAACCLIAAQYLFLRYLGSLDWVAGRTIGNVLLPSPWWRMAGTFVPLLVIGTAMVLHLRWSEGVLSTLAWLAMTAFIPFASGCLLVAWLAGPWALETMSIPNGGRVILAVDEGMTDVGFVLFDEAASGDLVWRQISELSDIQDGPYAARPELVMAPDERWLLVRRAGIWTDAFRMVDGHPIAVAVSFTGPLRLPDDATFWRLRSARIEALSGLRP